MQIGLAGILTIIFVVLKVTHNIDWSWWWVLSPLWIGAAVTIIFLLIFGSVAAMFTGRRR
jgi:hypothetical protein